MKNMKTSIFKRFNGFISFLLTILGFGAACSLSSCEYGTPAVEYGTPYATFKVNGSVKSEVTSNNIPNIRVVMGYDTTFTDESGNYQISNKNFPDDQTFLVEFKDIDGETNGEYQPLDTIVEFIDPEFSGGTDNWDSGETEKEVNVKLKDKE
jgi:putative lipoprotein (rSAM/lipoprotein system)